MIIKRNNITQTEKIRMLSDAIKVSERFARLLIGRGISDKESAEKFLYANFSDLSSPYSYDGVDKATEIISYHVANRNKIVVYGDYDCDGISAVSILMRALAEKGADIDYYIPVRQEEGYGLNKEAISKIKSEYNPDLLITVDCGITAVNEIEFAKNLGIEVIVTDHHTVGSTIPECTVVDPCLNKNATPLCGAGVAFTLIRALYGDNYAKKYADICAVATVADIVPLVDDNRIIVKSGLEQIKRGYGKVGLNALLDVSGIDRKKLTSYDIGFKIAPRLNASGRLSTAHNSVKLLTTDDVTEAKFIAEELSIQNLERQEIGKQIFNEASVLLRGYNFADNKIVVLYGKNWREGVIGISAAKLTEYFNMPTILLTDSADGMLKGSARSINGINIYELIATQRDKLTAFGGHAMAAGLSLPKNNFKSFFEGINSAAKKYPPETFARVTVCDDELSVSEISADFLTEISLLEPHGFQNPVPVFCDKHPNISFNRIGCTNHAKGKTRIADAVCFGKWEQICAYENSRNKALVYTLGKNYFNGKEFNQIRIKKLIYEDFSVSYDTLSSRFVKFNFDASKTESLKTKLCGGARLDVFFGLDGYKNFVEGKDIAKLYAVCDEFEFRDTAVLSPGVDFPFGYYGAIVVHGKITDAVKTFFDGYGAVYTDCDDRDKLLDGFSVDELRDTYKSARNLDGKRFGNESEAYKLLKSGGVELCYEKFCTYFYILADLELIKYDDSGILIVNNRKTDIKNSRFYRYIYG